jgi:hypothetical protein
MRLPPFWIVPDNDKNEDWPRTHGNFWNDYSYKK